MHLFPVRAVRPGRGSDGSVGLAQVCTFRRGNLLADIARLGSSQLVEGSRVGVARLRLPEWVFIQKFTSDEAFLTKTTNSAACDPVVYGLGVESVVRTGRP
jgi:hypothetical protein